MHEGRGFVRAFGIGPATGIMIHVIDKADQHIGEPAVRNIIELNQDPGGQKGTKHTVVRPPRGGGVTPPPQVPV